VRERETKFKLPINFFSAFCLRLEEVDEERVEKKEKPIFDCGL
jgi:hypothetical protein